MSDLKPCPFCGCDDIGVALWCEESYHAMCNVCETETGPCSAKDIAIDKWNARTLPPEVEAVMEAATELCHDDHWGNNNCCQCNLCVAVLAWIKSNKRNEED